MKYVRNKENLHDKALRDYAESVALQNEADLAYLAMMAGVDLEDDEEGRGGVTDEAV